MELANNACYEHVHASIDLRSFRMNADILKRVVRAIADGSQMDLDRLADKIVDAERRTGHVKLAAQLEAILKQPRNRRLTPPQVSSIEPTLKELPLSRRHGESLA